MPRPRAVTPTPDEFFAANLATVRAACGFTLEQLSAATAGVIQPTTIWKSERAGRRVSIGEAVLLCDALGVDLAAMTSHVVAAERIVTLH